jgi:hypothetical protein
LGVDAIHFERLSDVVPGIGEHFRSVHEYHRRANALRRDASDAISLRKLLAVHQHDMEDRKRVFAQIRASRSWLANGRKKSNSRYTREFFRSAMPMKDAPMIPMPPVDADGDAVAE